jgi:hypothetical protein
VDSKPQGTPVDTQWISILTDGAEVNRVSFETSGPA